MLIKNPLSISLLELIFWKKMSSKFGRIPLLPTYLVFFLFYSLLSKNLFRPLNSSAYFASKIYLACNWWYSGSFWLFPHRFFVFFHPNFLSCCCSYQLITCSFLYKIRSLDHCLFSYSTLSNDASSSSNSIKLIGSAWIQMNIHEVAPLFAF